jgi:DNA end-binding protein Ku
MRPLWTGGISFGLIFIPVKLYSASKEVSLDFDLLEAKTLAPIRYARVSTSSGKEVPWDEIVKGYEYRKGDYVVIHDEDFEKANVRKSKTIDIVEFVNEDEVDAKFFEKPYYIEPAKEAKKTYALLVQALKRSKKIGIAKFVLREREHLAALKPDGEMLTLIQMRYKEELRSTKELDLPGGEVHISAKEVDMALSLIEQMSEPFRAGEYKDEYIEELREVIEDKANRKPVKAKGKAPKPTKAKDLMSDLRRSLEAMKSKRAHAA